jgi:AmiR/NasT family two-component response regulator
VLFAEIDPLRAKLKAALTKIHHLETALQSSRRIGAALGVLMARLRITLDAAFDLLSTASPHRNRKLRDLAEDILYTGTLDRATRQPVPVERCYRANRLGSRRSTKSITR